MGCIQDCGKKFQENVIISKKMLDNIIVLM